MPVAYILSQAGAKIGLNPAQLTTDRLVLLRLLNEAARELYDQNDAIGTLMEQVFKVNGDQTISLPYYVGPVRGVRDFNSMVAWHVNRMRPRYNQFNWKDMWLNVRIRNSQALQYTVKNQGQGVLVTPAIESVPVQVTLVGPTLTSSNFAETVTLDSNSTPLPNGAGFFKMSNASFLDYVTVIKNTGVNVYDIALNDIDGNPLTVIPNNMIEASYQILDVSTCPWLPSDVSTQNNYLEILYKKACPYLSADTDTFPSKTNFDDILVNKMMQLYKEEQDKPELAIAYDTKATRSLARKMEDQNKDAEDCVAFVSNPHDTIHRRIGSGRRRRFSMYGYRGYAQ